MQLNPSDVEALLIAVTGDYAKSVFLKQDNYVAAHMTRTEARGKDTFDRAWWLDYLLLEVRMNSEKLRDGHTINMFVGDALYHSWVMHYQITKEGDTFRFKRIL